MASRTAVSALPWHQCSAATLETLDVERRAGVVVAARALPADRGASDRAFRHSGTRKRRYLRTSLRVARSGAVLRLLAPDERREPLDTEAGVLCAVWNAGDEGDETASAYALPPPARAMPLVSQGRRSPAASSGRPRSRAVSSDVHRMENSSAGSMSMNDAVELLNDSPRRSKDGATRALDLSHPPRDKLSLRECDGEAFSMERERERESGEQSKRCSWVRVGSLVS
jgi:hypothetical protein